MLLGGVQRGGSPWTGIHRWMCTSPPNLCRVPRGSIALLSKILWRKIKHFKHMEQISFPGGRSSKESTCQCRIDKRSIPGSGRSTGEGNGNPLQYSCLENPMDKGAWWAQSIGLQRVGLDWATNTTNILYQASQVVLVLKNLAAMEETKCSSIPGSGRSLGGGHGNTLQ